MRRSFSILALAALLAVAAQPLWSSDLLFSYDGPLHLMRAFALDLTLHQGVPFPRWLVDLAYGYGYPIFDFYPPFSAYAVESIHLLGLGLVAALKLTFTFIIAASLAGAYLLGVSLFHEERYARSAGLVTAGAYVFFPYFMVGIYTRGALAEGFAAALLPWLVWSLRRLLLMPRFATLVLVGLLLAVLIVAHSLTAAIIFPFLGAYTLFELLRIPAARRLTAASGPISAALLGIGLSSFYWLPFLGELRLVKMGSGLDILSDVFETNFLKLSALVQPSLFYEYGGPPVPLGLVAMTIAALVLVGGLLAGSELKARGTIALFGALALLGAIAISEPARALWLAFPASSMIQSVWRVELLINLGVAVVIGSAPLVISGLTHKLPPGPPRILALAIGPLTALILVWTTMARLSPSEILVPHNLFDLAHLARFEVSGASPGTTTFGEYMPATVKAADLANYVSPKTDSPDSPSPEVHLLERDGNQWRLSINSRQPVSIRVRSFYFPDWRATIDGAPARLHPSTPIGLLTVDLQPGSHEVHLFQIDTPVRQIGNLLSAAGGMLVLGLLAYSLRRQERELWLSLALSLVLLGLIMLPALATQNGTPVAVDSTQVSVSPGLNLIGLTLADGRLEEKQWRMRNPTEILHIRPYWQVNTSGLADSPVTWRLTDGAGRILAQRTQYPRYGTSRQSSWVANEIVQDEYDLPLTPAIPPGEYSLQVSPSADLPFMTTGTLHLDASSVPASSVQSQQPSRPVNSVLGNAIRLLGFDAPVQAHPGQAYTLTLYWQAERDVLEDYTASVQLLDPDGKLVAQHDSITGEGLNPTSLWIPGETMVERRHISLPQNLKPGSYKLVALMYSLRDLKRLQVVTDGKPTPDNAVVLGQVQLSDAAPNDLVRLISELGSTP